MIYRRLSFSVAAVAGILLVLYAGFNTQAKIIPACIGLLSAGAGITFMITCTGTGARQAGFFLFAFGIGIASGFWLSNRLIVSAEKALASCDAGSVSSFTGVCYRDSTPRQEGGSVIHIDLKRTASRKSGAWSTASGHVMMLSDSDRRLFAGDVVEVKAGLSVSRSQPGIHFISYAKGKDITEHGSSSSLFAFRKAVLGQLVSRIDLFGFPAGPLFKALFLGIRDDLTGTMYEGFEKTGTLHILALSGLHAGIIYLLISFCLFFLPGQWLKTIAGFILILFFLFLAGPMPSLARAAIMLIVFGLSRLLHLERDSFNILAIAAIIILVIDPAQVFSLSFQLSFLALLGIFVFSPRITRWLKRFLPGFIALSLSFSLSAMISTAPVVFSSFGIVYPSGIIATLLLVPIVTVFIYAGLAFLLLMLIPVPFITETGGFLLSLLYRIIFYITSILKNIPGITLEWQWWHWIVFILFTLPFLFNIRIVRKRIADRCYNTRSLLKPGF